MEQYELTPASSTMPPDEACPSRHDAELHKRTLRKLDFLLLPFLALLFLFNSLDKSNVGSCILALPKNSANSSLDRLETPNLRTLPPILDYRKGT